jgi:predicted TIM-barrel fold metal-dependent hydrolase
MHSPWGDLRVNDAHVHFFSHQFFAALASQKSGLTGDPLAAVGGLLGWRMPPRDPRELAAHWLHELDRHGVVRAAVIASVPGDEESTCAAAEVAHGRLLPYAMFNPAAADSASRLEKALAHGLRGICLFPAMHRYGLPDERVDVLLKLAAAKPGTVVFVHCGVLTVGVREKLSLPSHFDLRFSNPIDLHAIALRYPEVPFVIPHFGAGFLREALMVCDLCPNVYLDTSSSNSWLRYLPESIALREVFRRAIDVAGIDRLLFGSDSSFFPRGWHATIYEEQSRVAYEIGLSKEEAGRLFGGNFDRLLAN